MSFTVVAFYKFFSISSVKTLQYGLKYLCNELNLCGIVITAHEGINGTVAGYPDQISSFIDFLKEEYSFGQDDYKVSSAQEKPFKRMKVKLKNEIVTLKQPNINPNKKVGTYVSPDQWNDLISQKDVHVIDTRNNFEVEMGTFENAHSPDTECFSEFPDYVKKKLDPKKHKKIAMFCTGGIRCEKASRYMLEEGFEEVYHLKGGILKYLEDVSQDKSMWMGECFVFDERVSLGHGLKENSK